MPGLDPFKISAVVEKTVTREKNGVVERRYYRFRGGMWYGGISTGDVVGCNLRCKFCWSWRYSFYCDKGTYKSPEVAANILADIARKRGYKYVRLSGGEPTIGFKHLLRLIDLVEEHGLNFILETNGLLLGRDESMARELAKHHAISVRVSFKGTSPQEFERLSGADRSFYIYQFQSLINMLNQGMKPCIDFYPAIMLSFSTPSGYSEFKKKLASIHPHLRECIDEEYVILYPHVKRLLTMNGLRPLIAYDPSNIPSEMI